MNCSKEDIKAQFNLPFNAVYPKSCGYGSTNRTHSLIRGPILFLSSSSSFFVFVFAITYTIPLVFACPNKYSPRLSLHRLGLVS